MINLWPLLLPAAAWSGWWMANRTRLRQASETENTLSREYVVGLNYLLNEQPDKAVDIFIKLLEVDSDTVETHLALGSLFRRRGEVDRALRIHQNLIARPQLSLSQRKDALLALGQDYMSAGVFDRAERIFLEVVDMGNTMETRSLEGLLLIYQQEKSWEKALDVLKKLEIATGISMHVNAAHYYCEMAEQHLKNNAIESALYCVKQALTIDRDSVRASLLFASIEIKFNRHKRAIQLLRMVPNQDAEFIAEIIEPLLESHEALGTMQECMDYFHELLTNYPRASLIFVVGEHMKKHNRDDSIDFVADKLGKCPSIRGLNKLIHWHLESAYGKVRDKLQILYNITSSFLENKPVYRCGHCGFGAKHLHWHCPSCKFWGRMKPIHGLEGD